MLDLHARRATVTHTSALVIAMNESCERRREGTLIRPESIAPSTPHLLTHNGRIYLRTTEGAAPESSGA
ncbi:hypothetical protein ACWFRM_20100, partial [Streptomyces sp. NPDC055144]